MSQNPVSATPSVDGGANEADVEKTGPFDSLNALPRSLKVGTAIVIIVALAIIFAISRDFYFHWFEVHTGTNNETGTYYAFWSGFGSDIGKATIVVGVAAAWRHRNGHVKGCPRKGRPVPGTPYIACPKHHPAHEGAKRNVSIETIVRAHEEGRKRTSALDRSST